jgi:protein involved in polysaccharide export with SLBB domain
MNFPMMKKTGVLICAAALPLLSACSGTKSAKHFDPHAKAAPTGSAAFQKVTLGKKFPPELLSPPKDAFRIGAGDKLEIEIMEVEGTRQVCSVMPDGDLYYQTAPALNATGLTIPELKTKLQASLKDFYRDPQVSIILRGVSSQRVWILGRVNTPGLYPLENPMTIVEAISRAGGLFASRFSGTTEELADLRHSFLVRNGEFLPVDFYALLKQGDLSQNIYLKSGDYIYLPSALSQEVYILGAVSQPKAIGFMDQVTLVSAVAEAKGLLPTAYAQRVVIIRGSMTQPEVATVNLNEIMGGKSPDIALQPRDIVWVPNSPWDRVETYTKLILNSFVSTVAANEGIHAASKTASPVQSSITINPTKAQ